MKNDNIDNVNTRHNETWKTDMKTLHQKLKANEQHLHKNKLACV
jgi:hypothetical protein